MVYRPRPFKEPVKGEGLRFLRSDRGSTKVELQ